MNFVDEIVEKKLYDLHTAYLATVISSKGATATVQPLGKTKQYGANATAKSPIPNIPVLQSARYRVKKQSISIDGKKHDLAVLEPLKAGDIVLCVCCERDISQAKKGVNSTPAAGHHSMSDSIVVGII